MEYREIPLDGYEGYYACDDGHVYTKQDDEWVQVKEHNQDGYMIASIPNNKFNQVHRLVAASFCNKNSEDANIIDHLNEDPSDNRPCNLEWVTQKENCRRAKERGNTPRKTKILCVTTGKLYDSIQQASDDMHYRYQSIRGSIKTGKPISGYLFKRVENDE